MLCSQLLALSGFLEVLIRYDRETLGRKPDLIPVGKTYRYKDERNFGASARRGGGRIAGAYRATSTTPL